MKARFHSKSYNAVLCRIREVQTELRGTKDPNEILRLLNCLDNLFELCSYDPEILGIRAGIQADAHTIRVLRSLPPWKWEELLRG